MKLKIGMNIFKIDGPYGGANQFANTLEKYLTRQGHAVTRSLTSGLDLILIVSSQKNPKTTSFDNQSIRDYLRLHPRTAVIQRINTLDEPRGVDLGINRAICETNHLADHTVYVSRFVKDFFEKKGLKTEKSHSIILNGVDENVFNHENRTPWKNGEKMRIVTHHWSANYLKGFDIYERLDLLLGLEPYRQFFEFCIIGNLPLGLELKNSQTLPATWGNDLGEILRHQHIYITAARHEASGQHHVEGMRCGLPVLFLNSGGIPEYCYQYGVEFTLINFEEKLLEIRSKYNELYSSVLNCPYTGTWMSQKYEELFQNVVFEKYSQQIPKAKIWTLFLVTFIERPFRRMKKVAKLLKKSIQYLQES